MPGSGKKPNTVSISRESVGINNRRPFSPALIAAHSGQALRRHLLQNCHDKIFFIKLQIIEITGTRPCAFACILLPLSAAACRSRLRACRIFHAALACLFLSLTSCTSLSFHSFEDKCIIAYPHRQYAILDICGHPQMSGFETRIAALYFRK